MNVEEKYTSSLKKSWSSFERAAKTFEGSIGIFGVSS
jgi:hypothetical protein